MKFILAIYNLEIILRDNIVTVSNVTCNERLAKIKTKNESLIRSMSRWKATVSMGSFS